MITEIYFKKWKFKYILVSVQVSHILIQKCIINFVIYLVFFTIGITTFLDKSGIFSRWLAFQFHLFYENYEIIQLISAKY